MLVCSLACLWAVQILHSFRQPRTPFVGSGVAHSELCLPTSINAIETTLPRHSHCPSLRLSSQMILGWIRLTITVLTADIGLYFQISWDSKIMVGFKHLRHFYKDEKKPVFSEQTRAIERTFLQVDYWECYHHNVNFVVAVVVAKRHESECFIYEVKPVMFNCLWKKSGEMAQRVKCLSFKTCVQVPQHTCKKQSSNTKNFVCV